MTYQLKYPRIMKLTYVLLICSLAYLAFQGGRAYHKKEVQERIFHQWGGGDEGTEIEGYINRGIPFPEY